MYQAQIHWRIHTSSIIQECCVTRHSTFPWASACHRSVWMSLSLRLKRDAFRGETLSSEQHWGGFSQLTYRQSAVKQVLCSLPAICPGRVACGGPLLLVRPSPCSRRPRAAPPKGAYHSWAGTSEVFPGVMGWPPTPLSTSSHLLYSCRRGGDEMSDAASIHAWMGNLTAHNWKPLFQSVVIEL